MRTSFKTDSFMGEQMKERVCDKSSREAHYRFGGPNWSRIGNFETTKLPLRDHRGRWRKFPVHEYQEELDFDGFTLQLLLPIDLP